MMDNQKRQNNKSRKQLLDEVARANTTIAYMQKCDMLTGFATLNVVRDEIKSYIQQHSQTEMAIFLLGLDNFGLINATMGSNIGDLLLYKVSERIAQYFPKNGIFARKGGDEFIIVLCDSSAKMAAHYAKLILKELARPFNLEGQLIFITASIGISIYPYDATITENLLANADIALSKAKEVGKNNAQFFTQKLGIRAQYLQKVQKNIHQALELDELFIHYQPQVTTKNKRIIGVEALLRWRNPQLGLIDPSDFIPLAENTGEIVPIGNWVLLMACSQCKALQYSTEPMRMSVNVSARQLQSIQARTTHRFINRVKMALEASSLNPELLELEITENIIMKQDIVTKTNLKKLKELGVRISCDDFGVGYSSFHRLKQLPLDTIKIDKSLIKDMAKNRVDFTIVRAIIAIAQQLKIECVAEGVENQAQFNLLNELGCDIIQGNYFSKPVTVAKLNQILQHTSTSS